MSSPIFIDGNWTVAAAVNTPQLSQPFPGDAGLYVLTQDFMQLAANFTALALNTAHPTFTDYVLTGESKPQPLDGGAQRWTRTYCKVPATRNDGGCIAYRFIGLAAQITQVGGSITQNLIGRPRYSRTVNCRIQHDYYLVGTGGTYTDETGIPLLPETQYYVPLGTTKINSGVTTFTPVYSSGNPLQALTGLPVDYLNDNATINGILFSAPQATIPSRTQYVNMIVNGTEIIAEGSKVTRWQGNIWDRVTVYIVAQ